MGLENVGRIFPVIGDACTGNGYASPRSDRRRIHLVRGFKVMFDFDLADLYDVPTKVLIQGVKRNIERFPEDFMFQLSKEELENWRSQFVTSNLNAKMGLRRPPYAFTEHGVTMLASVLRSDRAVQMSIRVVRAFIQLRQILADQLDLTARVDRLERQQEDQGSVINILAEEIDGLKLPPPDPPKRAFGFRA